MSRTRRSITHALTFYTVHPSGVGCCNTTLSTLSVPADTGMSLVPLSHQQVSPWPFKALASGTKKAERCCFKPLQALQILSCCFLTGPTQLGTACLTLWLLMRKSTSSLRLSSLLPFPSLSLCLFSLDVISLTSDSE